MNLTLFSPFRVDMAVNSTAGTWKTFLQRIKTIDPTRKGLLLDVGIESTLVDISKLLRIDENKITPLTRGVRDVILGDKRPDHLVPIISDLAEHDPNVYLEVASELNSEIFSKINLVVPTTMPATSTPTSPQPTGNTLNLRS